MESPALPRIESMSFEGVTYAHENHDATLRNCDFTFAPGVYRFQSIEGAGKSTLLQLIAGLVIPQSGRYLINGQDVSAMSFEEFLPYRLRIGYTFDYGGLINNRSIADNLLLPLQYHKMMPEKEARAHVKEMLEHFEIQRFAKERPAHVPGRVRKLAVLLRALVIHPQILLLDDPSVGLSESTQNLFTDYVKNQVKSGALPYVFMACYDELFLAQMPHEVLHIDNGLLYDCNPLERKQDIA